MTQTFHPVDIIAHKRDGLTLSDAEIQNFIRAIVQRPSDGEQVSEAQIAAWLMAIFLRGLNPGELAALTSAMRYSGETFNAAPLASFTVDKHSTGGVGDKTSLLIAPILAAAGLASPNAAGGPGLCVPMISGRALGHTGGTLDKLEAIPGFDTQLSLARFSEVLSSCGAALIGQTPHLVPADRILYSLRDHIGAIESPHLIAASIMSKKLAEDLDALVLDVKTGSGAFMKREEDAEHLARLMVDTGEAAGTRTVALLTRMDQPLGRFAGNWLEVLECVDILQGRRHPMSRDLIELTLVLSGWMLHLAGHADTPEAGARLADLYLTSGVAYTSWMAIVKAQGGDVSAFHEAAAFHKPRAQCVLRAERSGFLSNMDCAEVGWAVQRLGAGRVQPGASVSAHAGIEVHVKLGDPVVEGQPMVTLFSENPSLLTEPYEMLRATMQIAPAAPSRRPLVGKVLTKTSAEG